MTKWIAALCLGLGIYAVGAPAQAGGTKIFKDWMAACDNVAACSAYAFGGEDFDYAGYVLIHREAGPDAPLRLTVVIPPADDHVVDAPVTWKAVLDGAPLDDFAAIAATPDDNGSWRVELTPARSQAFVEAVRNGDDLVLMRGDDQAARFSLAGISATLLWFDETQDRLGTTSAILRKGPRSSPPAPAAPVVVRGPDTPQAGLPRTLSAAVAARPELKSCEVDYGSADDLTVARLSPGTLLWAIPCSRGAYNTIFAMLLSDEAGGHVRRAVFPNTPGAGADQTGELMNISYDPATRTLSNFDKARGIGDCGAMSDWVWTGKAFVLSAQSMMPDCRGVGPDDWPSVWKADVR
ncbi:MAG: DUF1176 domain-containing protein [Pseudomonadota bacterium]